MPLVKAVRGQEAGSKKQVIGEFKADYAPGHVIMVGDAPGDREAAEANGVAFYPICPEEESASWKVFAENMRSFMEGAYAQKQKEAVAYFQTRLPEEPAWKRG